MTLPPKIYSMLMKAYFTKSFTQRIVNFIEPFDGAVLLDAPCGTGALQSICMPCKYFGIDMDKKRIDSATKLARNGHFSVQNAENMSFDDNMFDRILASGLFHHVNNELLDRILKEFVRVLKPSGKLVVLDAIWPVSRLNVIGYLTRRMDEGKHVRHYNAYMDLFEKSFDVQKTVTFSKLGSEFLLCQLSQKSVTRKL